MDLDDLRRQIDLIDSELLKLVHRRIEFALRTRNLKTDVFDPERERQVFETVRKRASALLSGDFVDKLYRTIIEESRAQQLRDPKLVGFQGEHGAYSEIAIRNLNSAWIAVPCKEFIEVFEEVASGQLDLGVVPVENSLEGAVTPVNDLLIETDLMVVGEIRLPVQHCLLTLPETDYRDIRVVYSHPQALAQCRGFLTRNKLDARPYYDTSGAAMMLANDRPRAAAAIASRLAADIYGLELIKEGIEDHETNSTRFVILSRTRNESGGNKCSIVFATEHHSGALQGILSLFSGAGVNLTRIESRPNRRAPGTYVFLLDFEGSDRDAKVAEILATVERESRMYRFLGCYEADAS